MQKQCGVWPLRCRCGPCQHAEFLPAVQRLKLLAIPFARDHGAMRLRHLRARLRIIAKESSAVEIVCRRACHHHDAALRGSSTSTLSTPTPRGPRPATARASMTLRHFRFGPTTIAVTRHTGNSSASVSRLAARHLKFRALLQEAILLAIPGHKPILS